MTPQCARCGTVLLGDEVGPGLCANCQAHAAIQQDDPSASIEQPPSDSEPRALDLGDLSQRLRRTWGGPEWKTFRLGITLFWINVVLGVLLTVGTTLPLYALSYPDRQALTERLGPPVVILYGLLDAQVLVSLGLFCAVPKHTRLRALAWVVFGCALLAAVVGILWRLGMLDPKGPFFFQLAVVPGVLGLALLLVSAARALGDPTLALGFVAFLSTLLVVSLLGACLWFGSTDALAASVRQGKLGWTYIYANLSLSVPLVMHLAFGLWLLVLLLRLKRAAE